MVANTQLNDSIKSARVDSKNKRNRTGTKFVVTCTTLCAMRKPVYAQASWTSRVDASLEIASKINTT